MKKIKINKRYPLFPMPNLTLYGSMTFIGFSTVHLSATILIKTYVRL